MFGRLQEVPKWRVRWWVKIDGLTRC